jgi:hypothetical protein
MRSIFLITLWCCAAFLSLAQEPLQRTADFSRLTETLTGFQDQDADYEQIYENLLQTLAHPVDLNRASDEDLRNIHLLNEHQIYSLIQYRTELGDFVSPYELQAVPGFDLQIIEKLLPWIKITSPETRMNSSLLQRIADKNNSYLITRYERTLEKKKGFLPSGEQDKKFTGSAHKTYVRFRTAKTKDFSVGFTGEKDAGEKIRWQPKAHQYGFDFLSGHIQLQNKGRIKNLLLGDFQCQFGQGLILGGPFGLGKGGETISTVRKSNLGLLPYTSAAESGFYRGAAMTVQAGRRLYVTGFYSHSRKDATITSDSTDNTGITAFQHTGMHRNISELASHKKIGEEVYTGVINYAGARLDAGMIFNRIEFSAPVNKEPAVYNGSAFRGSEQMILGGFFNYTIYNFSLFAEASQSLKAGTGIVGGILGAVHTDLDMALLYRKYDMNFFTFYPNAFSENSQPQNEAGFYWGWKYLWKRKYAFSGYVDLFRFPWLGFRRYAPSDGYECLLKLSYEPSRAISIYIQAREESKARNITTASNLYTVLNGTKRNLWVAAKYQLTAQLSMQTRAQLNTYAIGGTKTAGIMMLQDITCSFYKFQISGRYALFDTDDHENRHYVYEADAWMAFSLPSYSGVGVRSYILLEYKMNKRLSLWARYARSFYSDRDTIGSGLDEIESNVKRDIKIQLLFRF